MSDYNFRIPSLDGLRALSILLVIIGHILSSNFYFEIYYVMGNLGVRIFFAISGFLITGILINEFEKDKTFDLKKFYFRRIFRIFPAYLFFLFVMLFVTHLDSISPSIFIPLFTYTSNYFFQGIPLYLVHTWSLAVEEQFYLIFPVILLLTGLKNFRNFLFVIIVITPVLRFLSTYTDTLDREHQFFSIAWNFHTTMDILASGCLFAICRNKMHENRFYRKFLKSRFAVAFLLTIIFFTGCFSESYLTLFYIFGITIMNLSIIMCIDWLIVNKDSLAGRFLNCKPLKFIGVLSYSIYLWQQPFTFYSEDKPWTHFPYNFILLIGFSLFTYYFVEIKFLSLRRKIEQSRFYKEAPERMLKPIES